MFKIKSLQIALFSLTISFSALAGGPGTYKVSKSSLKWTGTKVTGKHEGLVKLASGTLISDGKNLSGGSFDIDMSSISCTDISDAETNKNFVGHLKSDDFFGTDKHKTAHFVISKVSPVSGNEVNISGKMTIKGITKDISFPATVTHAGKTIKAKAKITIDRSEYDVKFRSAKFFSDLGDKLINDDFIIDLDMEAGI